MVDHFLGVYCKKNGRPRLVVPPEVVRKLTDYSWPGNVRELENVIERALVLDTDGTGLKVTIISGLWRARRPPRR